jgi:hypothetical protein
MSIVHASAAMNEHTTSEVKGAFALTIVPSI